MSTDLRKCVGSVGYHVLTKVLALLVIALSYILPYRAITNSAKTFLDVIPYRAYTLTNSSVIFIPSSVLRPSSFIRTPYHSSSFLLPVVTRQFHFRVQSDMVGGDDRGGPLFIGGGLKNIILFP